MIEFTAKELDDGLTLITVRGSLDEYTSDDFLGCLETEIEHGHSRIIVDCSNLEVVTSMGLGTLLRVHARMTKIGGDVRLAALRSTIAQLFSLVKVDRIFAIYPTVEDACRSAT